MNVINNIHIYPKTGSSKYCLQKWTHIRRINTIRASLCLYDSPDQQISDPECIKSSFHTLTASCRHGSECFTLTMITTSTKNSLHCEVKTFCWGSQGLNKSFHSTSSSVSCWREHKAVQHNLRLPSSPDRGRTKQRESGLKGKVHFKMLLFIL